jgi:PST family polysaccharide transporter
MVGLWLGPAYLGLYDRAYRVVQTSIGAVNQSLGRVAVPVYAKLNAGRGRFAAQSQEAVSAVLVLVVLPAAGLCAIGSDPIVELLLGPQWAASASLLALLAPYLVFRTLDENLLAYLLGTARTWERTVGWMIIAALTVVGILVLLPAIGVIGAPIAVGLAMLAGMLWQQDRVRPGSLRRLLTNSMRPLAALTVAMVGGLGARSIVHWPAAPQLLIEGLVVIGLYAATLLVLDRRIWSSALNALRDIEAAMVEPLPSGLNEHLSPPEPLGEERV